ncbi:MAG: phospholipid carrier-dependent glycosyltransferase [Nitrososphaera sp.]
MNLLAVARTRKVLHLTILLPLALSSFTHLWNPTGFPDLFFDEGIYMRRAVHFLEYGTPQEAFFHDHPFFGQIFLAGALAVIGYPDSLNPTKDVQSIESLYLAPRVLMGLLAIIDTFLIYKISEKRYDSKVALIAAILFAVMPVTWFVRRILLDSILLPFFLTSILFAVYLKDSDTTDYGRNKRRRYVLIALSGAFLGLAIFTKLPIVTFVPLVGYLVYSNGSKKLWSIGLWIIPVVLIPLLWPLESIATGQFDLWVRDVLWQANRDSDRIGALVVPLSIIDPVLLAVGSAGIVYSAIKRDILILLWLLPFLLFLSFVGYVQYFHIIPIIPVFCVAAALLINSLASRARNNAAKRNIARIGILLPVALFGFVSTVLLITTDTTSAQLEAAAFVLSLADDGHTSIIASPIYSWMYIYVFDVDNTFRDYLDVLYYPIQTEKIIVVSDNHLENDLDIGEKLRQAYSDTHAIRTFEGNVLNYDLEQYPYTSMNKNYEGSRIEIRTN